MKKSDTHKKCAGFYQKREKTQSGDKSSGNSKLVAYAYLSAFKFPDVFDVFTTCEVEICKGGCQNKCQEKNQDQELAKILAEPRVQTTTEPFFEGVELFGGPISCQAGFLVC